jgi:predicted MFS family arabinose efflux permease
VASTHVSISGRGTASSWHRLGWVPVAAVLLGAGWGSNQFTPMLLIYSRTLGLGTGTLAAMFGFYALGLIPGLLLAGPMSDARGRRVVVLPAAGLSLVATLALVAGGRSVALLFLGRLLMGLSSGAVFGAGTAWLRETSRSLGRDADNAQAARRVATAMTAGFALGPLAAGLLAQWAPAPTVVPYLPHLALMTLVLVSLPAAPEMVAGERPRDVRLSPPGLRSARFRTVVAPMAPWVFTAPAIAFALLPKIVGADQATDGIALTATITMLCALAGVLIQPLARRLGADARGNRAATTGLSVLAAGLVLGAVTALERQIWLLVPASIVLGCAYGLCLVAGLVEIQRLADQRTLGALTAAYYTLAYLGFAAPFLLALAVRLASYPTLLTVAAALALGTAALVTKCSWSPDNRRRRTRAATRRRP